MTNVEPGVRAVAEDWAVMVTGGSDEPPNPPKLGWAWRVDAIMEIASVRKSGLRVGII